MGSCQIAKGNADDGPGVVPLVSGAARAPESNADAPAHCLKDAVHGELSSEHKRTALL